MRLTWFSLVSENRPVLAAAAFAVALLAGSVSPSFAQAAPPAAQAPAAAAQPAPEKPAKAFENDAAVMLIYVKSEKTADFEDLMTKLKDGLAKMEAPEAKQQAAGLKVFKAPAGPAPAGSTLYVMVADPVVKNVEYWFLSLLYKAYPNDTQALYQKWQDTKAATGPVFFDLTLLTKMQ